MSALSDTTSGAGLWERLDPTTREELDSQFLRELADWDVRGLTDEGVRAYLAYRHERPNAAITTYEEGQIRKILRHHRDPALVTHLGALGQDDATPGDDRSAETYWVLLAAAVVLAGAIGLSLLLV